MVAVDYDGRMAAVYDAGRTLQPTALEVWMDAAARHAAPGGRPILDLGSGTGRFSRALAGRFGVLVVGLEPAAGMRAHAARRGDAGVALVAGKGAAIPMSSGVFGAVWASQVIHHVEDRAGLAGELARVLMPDGRVLLRGMLTGRLDAIGWAPWFPEAARMAVDQFPHLDEITSVFAAAGLRHAALELVSQPSARDLAELLQRTRQRADSVLARLGDTEFTEGLARMEADLATGAAVEPVVEVLDLAVFVKVS